MAKEPKIKRCPSAKFLAVLGSASVDMVYRQEPKVGLITTDALSSVMLDYLYSGGYSIANLFHVQFS